jgi:branched-chain amino acid transport system permease protein
MKNTWKSSKPRIAAFAGLVTAVFFYPLLLQDQYAIRLGILCLMYSSLALSLNLLAGFMGQISLGHAAFMGIGAYTSALLAKNFALSFWLTMPCAAVVSAFFGTLLGIPAMKLTGSYLAIVTLGFCEIVRLVELNWVSLTRGPMGITGIPRPTFFSFQFKSGSSYYYLCLGLLLFTWFVIRNLMRSRYGRSILSIREDAVAAEAMGVDVIGFKVLTFSVSSGLTGMMGAFYAHYMRFIDPTVFNFDQSTGVLSMVILGGLGSLPGSVIGAILMTLIPEALRGFQQARMMLYGLVLAGVVIFRPSGILGNKNLPELLKIQKKYARQGMHVTLDNIKEVLVLNRSE